MPERLRLAGLFSVKERLTAPILLAVCLLAYGLLFLWQGFYWDDFPLMWIAETYGLAGLARYFSTNRPVWGLLYQASHALLGDQPWQWQLFGLFWRWVSALVFWLLLRQVWPRRPQPAVLGALLFLVYPGFGQQAIGMVYGHFFWVLSLFLYSQYAGLKALRGGQRAWLWMLSALLASAANLVMMEYFFLLELVRPLLYWLAFRKENQPWRRALRAWLPFLLVFAAAAVWRVFFFEFQTQNYGTSGLDALRGNLLSGALALAGSMTAQIWRAGAGAWAQPFLMPDLADLGRVNSALYILVCLVAFGLAAWLLMSLRSAPERDIHNDADGSTGGKPSPPGETVAQAAPGLQSFTDRLLRSARNDREVGWPMLLAGGFLLLVAGGPFYLTGLPVRLGFPNDRFTLPFIPGSALTLCGLLYLLPLRKAWPRILLAAVLVGLSAGHHFANSTAYRRDWTLQKAFFWQLTWRAPGLAAGTTLLSNDLPLRFYSDNSLTAPLNWIYAPENRSEEMDYMYFYPSVRLKDGLLPALRPGLPINVDYLAADFHGSTDKVVVIYYQPPACLRVIDGQVEQDNLFLPVDIRSAATNLGSSAWILPGPAAAARPPAQYYDPEPAHGWCYYYQKADLARQQGDWQQVADLGEQAFALGDYPNDPAERLPFIEGYAHLGRWDEAHEQSRLAGEISPAMGPVLCRLWQRIAENTPADEKKDAIITQVSAEIPCRFEITKEP